MTSSTKPKRPHRGPTTKHDSLKTAPDAPARDWLGEVSARAGIGADGEWALRSWLAEQFVADEFAKLGQGGHTEDRVPLRRVFVDLPISGSPVGEADGQTPTLLFLQDLSQATPYPLSVLCGMSGPGVDEIAEEALSDSEQGSPGAMFPRTGPAVRHPAPGRGPGMRLPQGPGPARAGRLLIGGPGQGKSTLGQLACQLHRSALLRFRAAEMPSSVREILRQFDQGEEGLSTPQEPLFPLRMVLPDASAWLRKQESAGLDPAASPPRSWSRPKFKASTCRRRPWRSCAMRPGRSHSKAAPDSAPGDHPRGARQHHKCCYCEHKIKERHNDVEHHRPKGRADRRPGSIAM